MTRSAGPPLVLHVMFSFAVGGLENGVVNLINGMSPGRWRHGILALTEISDTFVRRIRRDDVHVESLHKRPGHLVKQYPQVYDVLKRLSPAVVHTRNLAALEVQVPAWAARVPVRVHGEHGWDVNDPGGQRRRYQLMRRLYVPFVHRYVTVSSHLRDYLVGRVGIDARRVEHLCNGVDSSKFMPAREGRSPIAGSPFDDPSLWLVGTIGRLQPVKDQTNLARAFVRVVQTDPEARRRMRLVIVGPGPLRERVLEILHAAQVQDLAWLPGEREDIADVLRGLDLFVLPSLAEGISNTILEAMACGLPVAATDVGGNAELVADGVTGTLVPAADSERLAGAIRAYFADPARHRSHGLAARRAIEERFSLDVMVQRYEALYERLLWSQGRTRQPAGAF